VKHVSNGHALAAEAFGVGVVADLEDAAPDVGRVFGKEVLDVMAIDRQPAIVSELTADRGHSSEIAKPDSTNRREAEEPRQVLQAGANRSRERAAAGPISLSYRIS